jgi:hypothetical protein
MQAQIPFIDCMLGHSLKGVKDSYFLPQPDADGIYIDILEGHDSKSSGYIDAIPSLTINEENRLRRENEMLRIKKSEIEQLKEQAQEYKVYKSNTDLQLKELQGQLTTQLTTFKEKLWNEIEEEFGGYYSGPLDEDHIKYEETIHELLSNPKYDHSSDKEKNKKR